MADPDEGGAGGRVGSAPPLQDGSQFPAGGYREAAVPLLYWTLC